MGIEVTASSGLCEWRARSEADWIVLREGATGRGNGRVVVEIAPSSGPPRSGTVVIADVRVTVTQGDGCAHTISASGQDVPAGAGTGTVQVSTGQGCAWNATSQAGWITITSGATGSGSGSVGFSAAPNDGPMRTGTLSIAGHTFTVTQASGCTYSIDPASAAKASGGGVVDVRVTSGAGCRWNATSSAGWISIQSGATGSGGGSVRFSVAPNDGPMRTGTLSIARRTFTVTQASGCSYSIDPASATAPSGGGVVDVRVTSGAGCPWNATSNAGWISIQSGATGSGTGQVRLQVGANTGPDRNGTATIAGRPFTITQGSGCTYALTLFVRRDPGGWRT